MRSFGRFAALALLIVACGGTNASSTSPTSPTTTATIAPPTAPPPTAPATTATTAPPGTAPPTAITGTTTVPLVEAIESYRFTLSVGLTDDPGRGDVRPLFELAGEATRAPQAMRIFGELRDDSLDLVTDGVSWWDLEDPGLDLTADDVEFFLGGNGFVLPDTISALLVEEEAWTPAGSEVLHGIPTEVSRRSDMTEDRDSAFSGLALLEVWRDELGQVVKFTAWYAVGDNSGWPVATFEITERNPELEITIPD